jgi:hypothetical protein
MRVEAMVEKNKFLFLMVTSPKRVLHPADREKELDSIDIIPPPLMSQSPRILFELNSKDFSISQLILLTVNKKIRKT